MDYKRLSGIALVIVIIDQISKHTVSTLLSVGDSISIIPGIFNITYIRNPGIAFGLLRGLPPSIRLPLLAILSILAIVAILILLHRVKGKTLLQDISLSCILGGAAGNLVDRILYGEVVDFLDLHIGRYHWPAFNISDSAITIGVLVIFIILFSQQRREGIDNQTV